MWKEGRFSKETARQGGESNTLRRASTIPPPTPTGNDSITSRVSKRANLELFCAEPLHAGRGIYFAAVAEILPITNS